MKIQLIQGDCIEKLKELEENSVDSIVTDPPYGLGFMGKKWDIYDPTVNKGSFKVGTGTHPQGYVAIDKPAFQKFSFEWAKEALRVLKPGGHLLSFGGTRTYHRMAVAIEDAGFEIRDMIAWVYGSGFPKSLNIGKAVDKLQGNEREVVGRVESKGFDVINKVRIIEGYRKNEAKLNKELTKGTSEWEGWGTALKPAHEPIVVARKTLSEKIVALNVLKWGTGGINIDESRVEANWEAERPESWFNSGKSKSGNPTYDGNLKSLTDSTVGERLHDAGRFPANLIHNNSEEVRKCFPDTKTQGHWSKTKTKGFGQFGNGSSEYLGVGEKDKDGGSASRFFKSIIYTPKASKSERNMGCEGLEGDWNKVGTSKNNHPTVKPIALMEYLIKMITPKGGIVLDPFMGSGSTGVAAKKNGFGFIGIEKEADYVEIANARINNTPDKLL